MALRVTQQYVTVLSNRATGILADASQTIPFGDVATGTTNNVNGQQTIPFSQLSTGRFGFLRVSQQYVTVLEPRVTGELADVLHTINFTQIATGTTNNVSGTSTINFTQIATGTTPTVNADNTIVFGSQASVDTSPGDTINFAQAATAEASRVVTSTINFTQVAEVIQTAKNTVAFAQLAEVPPAAVSTIDFAQEAEPVRDPGTNFAVTNVTFVDAAAKLLDAGRSDGQTINFQQSATYELVKNSVECLYSPFVGSGASGNPTPPDSTLAAADEPSFTQGIQLRHPAGASPSNIVTLTRSMNIGDIDRLGFDKISRESRGKTLHVFADDQWPKTETLLFNVSAVCADDASDVLDFIETYTAEEIGLLTHEGRLWRGVILNPDEAVVQDGKDSYTINIEFEGRHEN